MVPALLPLKQNKTKIQNAWLLYHKSDHKSDLYYICKVTISSGFLLEPDVKK